MTLIETIRGPIDAGLLHTKVEKTQVTAGELTTTTYFLGDQVVKIDQHLDIADAALEAAGISSI